MDEGGFGGGVMWLEMMCMGVFNVIEVLLIKGGRILEIVL